jgi:hypothetical protein
MKPFGAGLPSSVQISFSFLTEGFSRFRYDWDALPRGKFDVYVPCPQSPRELSLLPVFGELGLILSAQLSLEKETLTLSQV